MKVFLTATLAAAGMFVSGFANAQSTPTSTGYRNLYKYEMAELENETTTLLGEVTLGNLTNIGLFCGMDTFRKARNLTANLAEVNNRVEFSLMDQSISQIYDKINELLARETEKTTLNESHNCKVAKSNLALAAHILLSRIPSDPMTSTQDELILPVSP